MPRFLDYYRQFQEMDPEEVSRGLRALRDAERARMLSEVPPLDLASPAWHEPPHPEIVNAATFALRRAVNAYPDATAGPVREALAARHDAEPESIAIGHGAGDLIRAALHALLAPDDEVAIAWPGWGPLPRLVQEAGGRPVPVPLGGDGTADVPALLNAAHRARAVIVCSPNDPTGGTIAAADVSRLAAASESLLVDAALADFEEPADVTYDAPNLLQFRSFSKAHAMAGFRAGYAIVPPDLRDHLEPPLGVSAPAQAGMAWAAENSDRYLPRRRALAAAEREHLAAALAGTPLALSRGVGPLVWLSSASHDGPELASHLASRRIFVTPGTAWGDDRHVRITLRDAAATDRLVTALRELDDRDS